MGTIFLIGIIAFLVLSFTAVLIASEREIGWVAYYPVLFLLLLLGY